MFQKEAIHMLATILLGYYDFGLTQDPEILQRLVRSAKAGFSEHRAILLRIYRAYGQMIPQDLENTAKEWLFEAGSTGSMTALEDMIEFGYITELENTKELLKTKFCGIGYELFPFDQAAFFAMTMSGDAECKKYILEEINKAESPSNNLREYHLRLAAAYGSVVSIDFLLQHHGAKVNEPNSRGDTALLFAARSGHKAATLKLLEFGADPRISNYTDDTPLHWLCSYDDEDVLEVAEAFLANGADIGAQANQFPPEDEPLDYSETDFVAGTPLHRAICRNKLQQTKVLVSLGADVHLTTREDSDMSSIALATYLHYPDLLETCLTSPLVQMDTVLHLRSGKSLLMKALAGGSLHGVFVGRMIRHGQKGESRAIETLKILKTMKIEKHFHDLPGESGCNALQFGVRHQPVVVQWLLENGCRTDLDRAYLKAHEPYFPISSRPFITGNQSDELPTEPGYGPDTVGNPPLFEAILLNRPEMVQLLLDHGADPVAHRNTTQEITAFYISAYSSFEHLDVLQSVLAKGVHVDHANPDHETPFQCAVRNGCFRLASFLRENGANVNILADRGLMWQSRRPHTLLGGLASLNSSSSLSGLMFLLDERRGRQEVEIMVTPSLNHTVFHEIATLDGDRQDSLTTSRVLMLCEQYFRPIAAVLNAQASPHHDHQGKLDGSLEAAGGNTALHYAAIHANYEVVHFLLKQCQGTDINIVNEMGMTAADIARLALDEFDENFVPRDIPLVPAKQFNTAKTRRENILRLLKEA